MRTRNSGIAVLVALGLAFCVSAKAGTIVYDSFTGADRTTLDGHTPDITINGASWTGGAWRPEAAILSGGKAANGHDTDASLSFTPMPNNVYTLSAEMTAPANSGNWMSLALEGVSGGWWDNGVASTLVAGSSGQVYSGNYGPSQALTPEFTVTAGTTHTYSLVLDTTKTNWTANWYFDGSPNAWHSYTYTTNPTINGISLYWYSDGTGFTIDNLTLSSTATPEPSTIVLLATGIIGLLAYAWRQRR